MSCCIAYSCWAIPTRTVACAPTVACALTTGLPCCPQRLCRQGTRASSLTLTSVALSWVVSCVLCQCALPSELRGVLDVAVERAWNRNTVGFLTSVVSEHSFSCNTCMYIHDSRPCNPACNLTHCSSVRCSSELGALASRAHAFDTCLRAPPTLDLNRPLRGSPRFRVVVLGSHACIQLASYPVRLSIGAARHAHASPVSALRRPPPQEMSRKLGAYARTPSKPWLGRRRRSSRHQHQRAGLR